MSQHTPVLGSLAAGLVALLCCGGALVFGSLSLGLLALVLAVALPVAALVGARATALTADDSRSSGPAPHRSAPHDSP